MTKDQIRTIRSAQRRANLNDAQYYALLHNVAGVESCKDLTNGQFEDCMAVIEEQIGDNSAAGFYWRGKVAKRGQYANERMIHKIHELHAIYDNGRGPLAHYELGGLIYKLTKRRTRNQHLITPHEAWKFIEELKAMVARIPSPPSTPAIVPAQNDIPF